MELKFPSGRLEKKVKELQDILLKSTGPFTILEHQKSPEIEKPLFTT